MQKLFYVYILTNLNNTVLYTGVTNNLQCRIIEHYLNRGDQATFAGRYHCHYLLYYETTTKPMEAICREKEIKGWTKKKKIELIKEFNPEMKFLNEELFGSWPPPASLLFHRKDLHSKK